jgi:hypothetical protein
MLSHPVRTNQHDTGRGTQTRRAFLRSAGLFGAAALGPALLAVRASNTKALAAGGVTVSAGRATFTEPPAGSSATLTTAAVFPAGYFLENLAVRHDGSMLVTAFLQKELWYVPPVVGTAPVQPVKLQSYDLSTTGIVEAEPDVFYVSTSDTYATHRSVLQRVDLRRWTPGQPIDSTPVLEFPHPVGALNGSCLLAPNVILLADSFAGLIWRVDLPTVGGSPTPRVWLQDATMAFDPNNPLTPPQPGVNGVRYASNTNYLYYTATTELLFMRVPVDPETLDPAGVPEFVAGGLMADDFCIDEDAGVAYIATHRQNTIARVPLDPSDDRTTQAVAGEPFDEQLIGPTSGAWGRRPGDNGRVVYVTTDGGLAAPPPDGRVRLPKVLRVELPAADDAQ